MGPGSNIARPFAAADAAPSITWCGRLPRFAVLIPRSAMGSWIEEWEDGQEPDGWVARRMADAFARMWAAAQPAAVALDAIRAAARDARATLATIAAQGAALAAARVNRWRPTTATSIASLVALVATRPAHGPPLLPA